MIDFLVENPFVLLFLVLGVGYLVGKLRISGFGLGVSAVLFVGLGFGALSPRVTLPEVVYQLGLIIFVYTVALAAGPGFVAALRRRGVGANLAVVVVLVVAAAVVTVGARTAGLSPAITAGVYTGATTNTPALAAALETVTRRDGEAAAADPVLGYSMAYPFGVLGMILAVAAARRMWRRDDGAPAPPGEDGDDLVNVTARITSPAVAGKTVAELMEDHEWGVVLSRIRTHHAAEAEVPRAETVLVGGDLVVVVGTVQAVADMVAALGDEATEQLPFDRSELDFRRVFVSASEPLGRRIADLRLPERFGAIITRVKRGDADHLARADTVLQPGDRVRVVAPRERIDHLSQFLGDSYRNLSEIEVATFSLGLVAGLLVGLVPVPLPGGGSFRLGLAGGPLVVGLVLGALERVGPIAWQLPYNANLTLRQLGAALFLAGIGVRTGYAFLDTLRTGDGVAMLIVGGLVTALAALAMLVIGQKILRVPVEVLTGMVAGMQTQPAVLAFAVEQSDNELPVAGYAMVYPVATLTKILLAQILLVAV